MIGANCNLVVATTIAGRASVRCRRWVPGFANTCGDCGGEAPAITKLRAMLDKAALEIAPKRRRSRKAA